MSITQIDRNETYLNIFKDAIKKYSVLSEEEWKAILDTITIKTAPKDTILIMHGQHENAGRFILEGHIKVDYHDDEFYVFDFRSPLDAVCDTISVFEKKLSGFTLTTITKCTWIEIDTKNLIELTNSESAFKTFMLEKVNYYFKRSCENAALVRTHSAEERYQLFCKENPEIVKHAKLGDIASFLGMTQQSLSRIRKRLL